MTFTTTKIKLIRRLVDAVFPLHIYGTSAKTIVTLCGEARPLSPGRGALELTALAFLEALILMVVC